MPAARAGITAAVRAALAAAAAVACLLALPGPATWAEGTAGAGGAGAAKGAPSLAGARWLGVGAALVAGREEGDGLWLAGPFAADGTRARVTDTASGLSVEVTLHWRDPAPDTLPVLSAEAGAALGLPEGAIVNLVIVALP